MVSFHHFLKFDYQMFKENIIEFFVGKKQLPNNCLFAVFSQMVCLFSQGLVSGNGCVIDESSVRED